METFNFTLSVIGPIFFILIIGYILTKKNVIDDAFVTGASRLIYLITLPVLLFIHIFSADVQLIKEIPLLAAGVIGTLISILLAWIGAQFFAKDDISVFVQGSFRGNLAIIGLSWAHNAYGSEGLAQAALLMAVITIVYNIAAISFFTFYNQKTSFSWRKLLLDFARNPLIASIVLALFCKAIGVTLPNLLLKTGNYLAAITLPLALLCIGANLNLASLLHSSTAACAATGFKLIIVPLIMLLIGWLFHLPAESMAILLLLAATPSATATFVVARAFNANSKLAANIIALSTLASIITASIGLTLLSYFLKTI